MHKGVREGGYACRDVCVQKSRFAGRCVYEGIILQKGLSTQTCAYIGMCMQRRARRGVCL